MRVSGWEVRGEQGGVEGTSINTHHEYRSIFSRAFMDVRGEKRMERGEREKSRFFCEL
jgi:hypothetical protein